MSEQNVRKIMAAIGQLADGYQREEVINASGNIILNCLRQEHEKHIDAEEQLEAMFETMRRGLRNDHYDEHGRRKDRRIILPPLRALLDS